MQSITPRTLIVSGSDGVELRCLMEYFVKNGLQHELVRSTTEAFDLWQKGEFELVVANFALPTIESLGLIRDLKAKNPNQAIIVLSEVGNVKEMLEVIRSGASDLITKPIDKPTLEKSVERLLFGVKAEQIQSKVASALKLHECEYEISTKEIADLNFPLPILKILNETGIFDDSDTLKIELAFQEALTNSVDHGNLELSSKMKDEILENGADNYSTLRRERLENSDYANRSIRIKAKYDGKKLTICIKDQGKGFSPQVQNDFKNNLNCYGRGLTIMNGMMEEVIFNEDGTEVTLVKSK